MECQRLERLFIHEPIRAIGVQQGKIPSPMSSHEASDSTLIRLTRPLSEQVKANAQSFTWIACITFSKETDLAYVLSASSLRSIGISSDQACGIRPTAKFAHDWQITLLLLRFALHCYFQSSISCVLVTFISYRQRTARERQLTIAYQSRQGRSASATRWQDLYATIVQHIIGSATLSSP